MRPAHAVGIDLGTTYSCISCLNEHGEPITIPNQEGEFQTPSVVLFDEGEIIVGKEALRHAIAEPEHVVQNSKQFIGDRNHRWTIGPNRYTAIDIASFILKKLISAAEEKLGPIEQAVITVPTQFSDVQRQETIEAGKRAGLKQVNIINEPVAAALCAVLGSEGLWFSELAEEQRVLVFDLGGGTFDLSLVSYKPNEVRVLAGSGDLNLGGNNWNKLLLESLCHRFQKDFNEDPSTDQESVQCLSLEVEETKRSLSVRERAPVTCHHAGHRKVYKLQRKNFEKLAQPLVDRAEQITQQMLKDNDLGWANVDTVMTTGGSSRMPMVREMLKRMSGRTLNTSLSPDQSIAHGAAYFAGMLLSGRDAEKTSLNRKAVERLSKVRQMSVNARALGIQIKDLETGKRIPHYLIKANTSLPTSVKKIFGTVVPNQKRIHIHILESGVSEDQECVELGACIIEDLPRKLPQGSKIEVTLRYDEQARVHVEARELQSGKKASVDIVLPESLVTLPVGEVVELLRGG